MVIGGGISGTSLAFHLAQAGAGSVVVLESDVPSSGATGKSGALIRCHFSNLVEAHLALFSLHYFHRWADVVGGDCGFRNVGMVVVTPQADRERLAREAAWQNSLGIRLRILDEEDLRCLDANAQVPEGAGLAFEPEAGYADPIAANFAMACRAQELGARFCLRVHAEEILRKGERVCGVRTSRGVIEAGVVVAAAGTGVETLLRPMGLNLGLQPALSRVSLFRSAVARTPGQPAYFDRLEGSWCRPASEQCTLFGLERTTRHGVSANTVTDGISADVIGEHRHALGVRFPVMKHAINRGGWAGLYTDSPDGLPLVGPLPYDGLYAIAGDCGSSFKTAPALGAGLSEWITKGAPHSVDLTKLHPQRVLQTSPEELDHGCLSAE